MKIQVRLHAAGNTVLEEIIEIDDNKLEELTEEEKEQAVEVVIRSWMDRVVAIDWETVE